MDYSLLKLDYFHMIVLSCSEKSQLTCCNLPNRESTKQETKGGLLPTVSVRN